jgi:hypothetical protein
MPFRSSAFIAIAMSLVGAVVGAATLRVPDASARVLWKADAESLMGSEWASSSSVPFASSPPRPDSSRIYQSTFRAQGLKSYRFELRNGDYAYGERVELAAAMPSGPAYNHMTVLSGQDRWLAMQYYLPSGWPSDRTWQIIFQIKPVSSGGGGPNIGVDAGGNRLMFYGNSNVWGSATGNYHDGNGPLAYGSHALTKGRWIKLTWHIVFSANPTVGSLEIFGDLADGRGMRTLAPYRRRATLKYKADGTMDASHLRVGIYRNNAMTVTQNLYTDGITMATTRAEAEANAYRGR